ncbi:MAG: hypothetical protein ACRYFX_09960 [Janthinobacterium lividum]
MALSLVSINLTQPVSPATTGSADVVIGGNGGKSVFLVARFTTSGGSGTINATPNATTGTTATFNLTALAPATYACEATVEGDPTTLTFSFVINAPTTPPVQVLGCISPNAFNYDPAANTDTTPTSCVYALVDVAPAQLVAAHLPIPVVVRAAPTVSGAPAVVRLLLETAPSTEDPSTTAAWVEFGQLKKVCGQDASASFNLSEAAKSLLRITPPVESGTDASLSALLRVRYERIDPETRQVTDTDVVGSCRVLNAVVQPVAGAELTAPLAYDSLPTGAAYWLTSATYLDGIVSTDRGLPLSNCPAVQQFMWLNAKGAWDSGFFTGRHVHGTDQADPISYRDTAGADRYAKRGTVRDTLQVYSDKVDFATYSLLRGVRNSVQVYERLPGGGYVPVLVASESYQEYQEQTDKTFQVNFTVSYPAQLIQTQ